MHTLMQELITLRRHTKSAILNSELNYFWSRITRLLELGQLSQLGARIYEAEGRLYNRPVSALMGVCDDTRAAALSRSASRIKKPPTTVSAQSKFHWR